MVNKRYHLLRLLIGCRLEWGWEWVDGLTNRLEVELAEVQSSEREIDRHEPEGLKPHGDSCLLNSSGPPCPLNLTATYMVEKTQINLICVSL